jgi:sugar phosphate isomerase/epimerase
MRLFTRRECLTAIPALTLATARADAPRANTLGFSLYGMKTLSLADALKTCREIGYGGVELALMPGYPAEPKLLAANDRKELRTRMSDLGLALHGLMENLPALGSQDAHKSNLERLKATAELGHALSPDAPPPIETVLGGKPAEWDKVKEQLAERLGAWAEIGKAAKTVVAVKPHVANALHTPDGAKWLLKQVDSPWLRLAFDFSHFELRGWKLADAIAALIPFAVFVHVKDAKGNAEKFEFLLPGQGATDYAAYSNLLVMAKYRGPVVVEVSGQLSTKAGYDPVVAAKASFAALVKPFALEKK